MRGLEWLGVVRHGESTGNVAARDAETGRLDRIDIAERDADVPLSDTGREQAAAVNRWLSGLPADRRPTAVVVSPYLRTRQTAAIALEGHDLPVRVDERLRDRELGVLDLLTARGVEHTFPDEAARRRRLGKFYYRPPGGESWVDVIARLRSLLRDVADDHPDERVLLVAHDAVVSLVRYVVEGLEEDELMAWARANVIANCSISSWRRGDDGTLEPELLNDVRHLERDPHAEPTAQEDVDDRPA